jgi:hypothetical protein
MGVEHSLRFVVTRDIAAAHLLQMAQNNHIPVRNVSSRASRGCWAVLDDGINPVK